VNRSRWCRVVAIAALVSCLAPAAHGQGGLAQAILALDDGPDGPIRIIDHRLFGATVVARIIDRNNNGGDFADVDEVEFTISRGGDSLPFIQEIRTRAAFEDWAEANTEELLEIIFPGSLSEAVLGHDAGQLYSQQLLLTTALGVDSAGEPGTPRRYAAGGLVEYEWFDSSESRPDYSGHAWQGLYGFGRFASVQARYAHTTEDLTTDAYGATFDYHPFREIRKDVIVRYGATARTGFVYSLSKMFGASGDIDLGTVDFGGGGWASLRKNFRRVRLGGAGLVQGTKTFVPIVDEPHLDILAGVINGRAISWDFTYGGTAAVDTTRTQSVIVKYLESQSVKADFDRPTFRLMLVGYSLTLAPGRSLDVGYKRTSTAGMKTGSVFVQGNFGW